MSSIRCTNCTWRGDKHATASMRPPRPSVVPGQVQEIQQAYAEKEAVNAQLGVAPPPPCPVCGHHTVDVTKRSIRPSAF